MGRARFAQVAVDVLFDEFEREGGACPVCAVPARLLTCWECCDVAWVIACDHRPSPPMRHGRGDGSEPHRVFCFECAAARV